MWDLKACRGCLQLDGNLEKLSEPYLRLYLSLTGVQMSPGDGYPSYFCVECRHQMKKCLAFRRRCRRAYFVMKEIITVKKQLTVGHIGNVNRTRTNLKSNLGYSDILVDSCPEIIEEEPEITDINDDQATTDQIDCDDIKTEEVEEIKEPDIDLDDVFKGLEEKEQTDEEDDVDNEVVNDVNNEVVIDVNNEVVDEVLPNLAPKRVAPTAREVFESKYDARKTAKAMCAFNIKLLSPEEQLINFEKRRSEPKFVRAIYKCLICVQTFSEMNLLMGHAKRHNLSVSYKFHCNICKSRFKTVDLLEKHANECHLFEYKCKICDLILYARDTALVHKDIEHPNYVGHIEQIDAVDPTDKKQPFTFSFHYNISTVDPATMYKPPGFLHADLFPFSCETCHLYFTTKTTFDKHIAIHNEPVTEDMVSCDICGIVLTRSIKHHMEDMHLYRYSCKQCNAVLYNKMQAKQHIRLGHPQKAAAPYKCEHCSREFRTQGGVYLHIVKAHADICQYSCVRCGHVFRTLLQMYTHQLMQHQMLNLSDPANGDPLHFCVECDLQFVSEHAYKMHCVEKNHKNAYSFDLACMGCRKLCDDHKSLEIHLVHCSSKAEATAHMFPRTCYFCNMTLANITNLKQHYNNVHAEHRLIGDTIICDICGKTVLRRHLPVHVNNHTKTYVKRIACKYCGMMPKCARHLLCHILLHHARKPYCCTLCDARYTWRSDAKNHVLKLHAPVRPYKCQFCSREFSHIDFLNEHSKKIHDFDVKKKQVEDEKNGKKKKYVSKLLFCTYPHIHIDVSAIDEDVLSRVPLEVWDYADKNKVVATEPGKYLRRGPVPDLKETDRRPVRKRKTPDETIEGFGDKPKKSKKTDKDAIKKIVVDESSVKFEDLKAFDDILISDNVANKVVDDIDEQMKYITEGRSYDHIYGDDDDDVSKRVVKENDNKDVDFSNLEIDPNDIIYQDGERFVVINDVMYKIEVEDET